MHCRSLECEAMNNRDFTFIYIYMRCIVEQNMHDDTFEETIFHNGMVIGGAESGKVMKSGCVDRQGYFSDT